MVIFDYFRSQNVPKSALTSTLKSQIPMRTMGQKLKNRRYPCRLAHRCRVECRPDDVFRGGFVFPKSRNRRYQCGGESLQAPKSQIPVRTSRSMLKNRVDSLKNEAQKWTFHFWRMSQAKCSFSLKMCISPQTSPQKGCSGPSGANMRMSTLYLDKSQLSEISTLRNFHLEKSQAWKISIFRNLTFQEVQLSEISSSEISSFRDLSFEKSQLWDVSTFVAFIFHRSQLSEISSFRNLSFEKSHVWASNGVRSMWGGRRHWPKAWK